MKNVFLAISLLLVSMILKAQTANIQVELRGFENEKGQVLVGLYNSETDFLNTEFKGQITKINADKTATVVFKDVPTDKFYAVSVFHDENENQQLDRREYGIPAEAYGFSNGARGVYGPPTWNDTKFELTENKTVEIVVSL